MLLSEERILVANGENAADKFCARIFTQLGAHVTDDCSDDPGGFAIEIADARGIKKIGGTGPPQGRCSVRLLILSDGVDCQDGAECGLPEWAGMDLSAIEALSGAHAAVAGLAALRWCRRNNRTTTVEVSMREVAATCLGNGPTGTPGLFVGECKAGHVAVSLASADDRLLLQAVLQTSCRNIESLHRALASWLRHHNPRDASRKLQEWRIPALAVASSDECKIGLELNQELALPAFRFCVSDACRFADANPAGSETPLVGTRILDLGMVWAGPHCGRLLAALGAEVIKIEGPNRPDGTRRHFGPIFADLNAGKESLLLDLNSSAGRLIFLDLVKQSDGLIENFSPRVMPNFGLAWATLTAANPQFLAVSMPAFGRWGEKADYVAYGQALELACGLAHLEAGGSPEPTPVAYLDYVAGACAAAAMVAALIFRDKSGRGVEVELSQYRIGLMLRAENIKARRNVSRKPADLVSAFADRRLRRSGFFRKVKDGKGPRCARPPWCISGVEAPAAWTEVQRPGEATRRILREVAALDTAGFELCLRQGIALERDGAAP
jgi:crotonobetainyl-CoA:carnitine CoA-transferase CaiB-like acyl-CoA transferase